MTKRSESNHFTLVELLIVVAIILVLLSLIQPALRYAILNAHLTSCMNQLKQNGLGLNLYADDNNGRYPDGNAKLIWNYGYGSTYSTSFAKVPNTPMGLAIVYTEEYLNIPQAMYCPLWEHPYLQLHEIDDKGIDPWFASKQIGGWTNEHNPNRPTKHMGMSYAYRGTMGTSFNEPANPNTDASETAILVDHFSRREVLWGPAFGHPNSYNALTLDGSVKRKEDLGHIWMRIKQPHTDLDSDNTIHTCKQWTNGVSKWYLVEQIFQDFFESDD